MKKNNSPINVVIYCRVSTDEQRKGTSVEVQEERLREYCERKGYNIIELPNIKEDESAKTFKKRPVMQSILKFIKSHKKEVNKLLFLRWNRFSRDLPQAANVVQELLSMGIEPNAIEEKIDFNASNWPTLLGIKVIISAVQKLPKTASMEQPPKANATTKLHEGIKTSIG